METRLLIGGELVEGAGPGLDVEDPAREAAIATVRTPDAEQLDAAIAAARTAQREWAATPAAERAEALHEVAARMRARTDELAELMTREGGKPLIENRDEVGWTARAFDYYAELARTSAGRVIPPVESSQLALVLKEPLGVVGLHRAVELPAAPARLEARAGARRRQRGGLQAVGADAADHPRARAVPRPSAGRRGRHRSRAAATSAPGWSRTSASTASPSPGASPPARGSPSVRPRASRG